MIYSIITGFFLGGVVLIIGNVFDNTISVKSKKRVMDKNLVLLTRSLGDKAYSKPYMNFSFMWLK